ncbi:MAG: hypothetical protein H7Y02_08510 [Candidatus Obscuribacterales bacterium]|nr:hypothetical protein [Steroidobacteraceae bacterium]
MKYLTVLSAFGVSLMLTGCGTMQAYDGVNPTREELAHIAGDWRVRAGAPLSLILRRVDEFDVGLRYSAVDVLAGRHRLLVDCSVAATGHISRHELEREFDAGGHYRLSADTMSGNRECGEVHLERVR